MNGAIYSYFLSFISEREKHFILIGEIATFKGTRGLGCESINENVCNLK